MKENGIKLAELAFMMGQAANTITECTAFKENTEAIAKENVHLLERLLRNTKIMLGEDGTEEEVAPDYEMDDFLPDEITIIDGGKGCFKVGDIVELMFFGKATEFRVVHKGYSANDTLMLMPEQISLLHVINAEYDNRYVDSEMDKYLNSVYLSGFRKEIQDVIINAPFESYNNGENKVLYRKIRLVSATEVGFTGYSHMPKEGKKFDYFDCDEKRIKAINGSNRWWWLRTPNSHYSYFAWYVNTDGTAYNNNVTRSDGVVPCFEI